MFVKIYVKSSTFHICGRIHDIFPHYIFVEAYFSYTFNICGRLCLVLHLPDLWKNRYYVAHLIFVEIYIFPMFNICGRLCLVFHILHLWKNTWCSSRFLFHESILIFVESYDKSSTFLICGRIHDIFPHFYFLEVYLFFHLIFPEDYACIVLNLPHCGRILNTFTLHFCWSIFFLWKIMFSLPPSRFVEEYIMFFHISILWKYVYSSIFKLVGNIGKSSTFHICETILDILPHFYFMEVYIFFHLQSFMFILQPSILWMNT